MMQVSITPSVIKAINNSVLCWLATSGADGQPNVSPKEIFAHYEDDYILIANIMSPQTIKNINVNPKVCISFIDVLVQKGFQLKGSAVVIERNHVEFETMHRPLFDLAGPSYPIASVIKVKVHRVKAIIAPRYVFFPETTEADQIESAKRTYKLK